MNRALDAHLRLLATLPVHTHHCTDDNINMKRDKSAQFSRSRPIRIYGQEFASITQAKLKLKIGAHRLYEMLRSGEAEYV